MGEGEAGPGHCSSCKVGEVDANGSTIKGLRGVNTAWKPLVRASVSWSSLWSLEFSVCLVLLIMLAVIEL